MWNKILILQSVVSLGFNAAISMKLKDVKDVEQITYLNSVAIAINVGALASAITLLSTIKYYKIETDTRKFSILVGIISSLINSVLYIMALTKSEMHTVPTEVKTLIYAYTSINLLSLVALFIYFFKTKVDIKFKKS
jgi:hypothetical protein